MAIFFQNKRPETPSMPPVVPPKPVGKIDPMQVLTIGAIAATALYAVGFVVRLVFTPVLLLAATVILAHIWARPEKSRQIAKKLLEQTPDAIKASIQNFPDAMRKAYELSVRVYNAGLQYVGNKVLPTSTSPHKFGDVAQGVYETVQPKVVDCVESGLQMTERALLKTKEYTKETVIPAVKKQFERTCPPVLVD